MCVVNEQVRHFGDTGIRGDGRTAAELQFEESLEVNIRQPGPIQFWVLVFRHIDRYTVPILHPPLDRAVKSAQPLLLGRPNQLAIVYTSTSESDTIYKKSRREETIRSRGHFRDFRGKTNQLS